MAEFRRYNYSKKRPGSDNPINPDLVPYLSCVDTPFTLIGVSVRNILSSTEYSVMVRDCKKRARNNCELCGRYVARTKEDFIHSQELYDKDLSKGIFKYKGLVGLCKDCFYMFNPYIMNLDLENLVIKPKYVSRLRQTRESMLSSFGFRGVDLPRKKVFVLEYRGYQYINDSIPSILDRALGAGVRVLPMRKDFMAIHPDLYYHKPLS